MKFILATLLFIGTPHLFAGGIVVWNYWEEDAPQMPAGSPYSFVSATPMVASSSLEHVSTFTFKHWPTINLVNLETYFEFSVLLTSDLHLSRPLSFTMDAYGLSDTTLNWEIRTSRDSFQNTLAFATTTSSGRYSFDISSLPDIYADTSVTFRIYGFGGASSESTFGLQRAELIAPIWPVPEPKHFIFLLLLSFGLCWKYSRTRRCS